MKQMTYRLSGHVRRSPVSFATLEGRLLVVSISRAVAHHLAIHLYTWSLMIVNELLRDDTRI